MFVCFLAEAGTLTPFVDIVYVTLQKTEGVNSVAFQSNFVPEAEFLVAPPSQCNKPPNHRKISNTINYKY